MDTAPPLPPNPAPTVRLVDCAEESPQAATVHLDSINPPADTIDDEYAPVSFVRGFLAFILPIGAFIAVIVFTVPAWEAVKQEIRPAPILTALAVVLRVWIAYRAARYVAKWISPRGE